MPRCGKQKQDRLLQALCGSGKGSGGEGLFRTWAWACKGAPAGAGGPKSAAWTWVWWVIMEGAKLPQRYWPEGQDLRWMLVITHIPVDGVAPSQSLVLCA